MLLKPTVLLVSVFSLLYKLSLSVTLPLWWINVFIITVDDLISKSTHDLFNKMCIPSHCLHHLLPDHRVSNNLRLRGHGFQLPTVLHRNSFVTRSLFLYVWILMCVCLIVFNKRLFKGCSTSRRPFGTIRSVWYGITYRQRGMITSSYHGQVIQ